MQVTQADSSTSKRVGVAEHLIKFRSSPNLKNMKKFIRSKMDHIEVTNLTSPDLSPPPNSRRSDPVRSDVQPPLPLDPPPPDKTFHLKVKQEIDVSKYENNSIEEIDDIQNKKIIPNGVNSSHEESPDKPKVPICRDYIRGSCKRPGTCRYAHKYDLTQLVGVYTFCRSYQTSVCTFPNCKYVHASVFEEHHFYRTGILPPHALAHHKKGNAMQQLNLPPPAPQDVQNGMSMDMTYANPPPPILNESGILNPHVIVQQNKVNVIEPPPPPPPLSQELQPMNVNHQISFKNPPPPLQNEISPVDSKQTKSTKRVLLEHQSNINQIGSSPSDNDTYEPFPKKCKHCDFMDFRLQYHKDETKKMARAKDQKTENTCDLETRRKKINKLILALFRLPCNNQNHDTESSFGGDKDKSLEHLNGLLTTNGRMAAIGEDE